MKTRVSTIYPDNFGYAPQQALHKDGKRKPSFVTFAKERIKQRMNNVKKFQFFIIFLVCMAILAFQTAQCVDKYLEKSTGTADKYVHVSKTSFPIMTICPTYPYKLTKLKEHGLNTKNEIQFGANWVSKQQGISPTEFYKDVVLEIDDIVKHVDVYVEVAIEGKNLFRIKPGEKFCDKELFKTKQYYYNGDCFALRLPSCILDSGVLEVVFDFYNKTDIFIHHPGQFLSPNSR